GRDDAGPGGDRQRPRRRPGAARGGRRARAARPGPTARPDRGRDRGDGEAVARTRRPGPRHRESKAGLGLDALQARYAVQLPIEAEDLIGPELLHLGNQVSVSKRDIETDEQIEHPTKASFARQHDPRKLNDRQERVANPVFGDSVSALEGEYRLEDDQLRETGFQLAPLDTLDQRRGPR